MTSYQARLRQGVLKTKSTTLFSSEGRQGFEDKSYHVFHPVAEERYRQEIYRKHTPVEQTLTEKGVLTQTTEISAVDISSSSD